MDSDFKIIGDTEKATFLDDLLRNYLFERVSVACEVSLGTGDVLLKPFTDGNRIGVDIIDNNNFYILESIGNMIKSIAIKSDEIKKGYDIYTRFETQMLKEVDGINYLIIRQSAFRGEIEVPLSSIQAWASFEEEIILENVDKLLLGRIKSPTVNRNDVNGPSGVKITFGNEKIIQNIIDAYDRFNREYSDKETMIFASKTLFTIDNDGNAVLPKGKKRLFHNLKPNGDNNSLIHEFSPEIRTDSLERGIELNLKILEMACGLSSGILTAPHTNFATATEMKASLQNTFAYITKFRHFVEHGVIGLIDSIGILADINKLSQVGEFEIEFDWSTAYIEQLTEQFNRLMQAQSIGAVDEAEVRAFVLDEDIETSKVRVDEIKKLDRGDDFGQI